MFIERISLVLTAVIFYGYSAIVNIGIDNEYSFYIANLTIFSSLYHYYDEKKFFEEDFICCFFIKLYLCLSYIIWLNWWDIAYYIFVSDILGNFLFYLSYRSWMTKGVDKRYMIVHNLWHFYTAYMLHSVVKNEVKVDIGRMNYIIRELFVLLILGYNIRKINYKNMATVFLFILPEIFSSLKIYLFL